MKQNLSQEVISRSTGEEIPASGELEDLLPCS
jgi:hypothetical protein